MKELEGVENFGDVDKFGDETEKVAQYVEINGELAYTKEGKKIQHIFLWNKNIVDGITTYKAKVDNEICLIDVELNTYSLDIINNTKKNIEKTINIFGDKYLQKAYNIGTPPDYINKDGKELEYGNSSIIDFEYKFFDNLVIAKTENQTKYLDKNTKDLFRDKNGMPIISIKSINGTYFGKEYFQIETMSGISLIDKEKEVLNDKDKNGKLIIDILDNIEVFGKKYIKIENEDNEIYYLDEELEKIVYEGTTSVEEEGKDILNIKKLNFEEFVEIEVGNKKIIVNSDFKNVYNLYKYFVNDLKTLEDIDNTKDIYISENSDIINTLEHIYTKLIDYKDFPKILKNKFLQVLNNYLPSYKTNNIEELLKNNQIELLYDNAIENIRYKMLEDKIKNEREYEERQEKQRSVIYNGNSNLTVSGKAPGNGFGARKSMKSVNSAHMY